MSSRESELAMALELALRALNLAPRFSVPSDDGRLDSYQICSELERVLRRTRDPKKLPADAG